MFKRLRNGLTLNQVYRGRGFAICEPAYIWRNVFLLLLDAIGTELIRAHLRGCGRREPLAFGNRVARVEVTTHIESRAWNALPSLTPASAPPTSPSAATPKESHDEEQQYCTDGSVDDCG